MPTAETTLFDALRSYMEENELDLLFIPSSDEHLNEYLPEKNKRRQAVTGFSGSAGDFLLGRDQAWLYVDGRYHLQAEDQVDTGRITVEKLGLPGVLRISARLRELARAKPGLVLGLDPCTVGCQAYEQNFQAFKACGGVVRLLDENPVDLLWNDRHPPARQPVLALPLELTGSSVAEKLRQARDDLAELSCQATVLSALDQIAWLLNRRGSDIAYNPVFEAYFVLLPESALLFVDPAQADAFAEDGLTIEPIADFRRRLPELAREASGWLVDPECTPLGVARLLEEVDGVEVTLALHPVECRKSIKNEREQAAVRAANLRASIGKTRTLCWLEGQIAAGAEITEVSFAAELEKNYAAQPDFRGLSFNTISATGPHGAIVHYGTPDPQAVLERGSLFLVDSGAHFGGGTTDATRTVLVGDDASAEQKRRFTLVLKGHAALAGQRFPEGVCGSQLDALARAPLWQGGEDYKHGTGHGVGAFLCVHEGPFGIATPGRGQKTGRALQAGQVTSIEPGVYIAGWGGVRLENLYLVVGQEEKIADKGALAFDPLVLIPFDRRLIDRAMLTAPERAWLDAYHARVRAEVGPHLDEAEQAWLEAATAPL